MDEKDYTGQSDKEFQNESIVYSANKDMNQPLDSEKITLLRESAERGDAIAQYKLGCYYVEGETIKHSSLEEAIRWWRKAAEQGLVEAQEKIAHEYYIGYGVPKSIHEAVKWWQKAAEQGNANAEYELGCCFMNGEVVSQSYYEAARWWQKAAEQGHIKAQFNLGVCYEEGKGVEQSNSDAFKYYYKAAEQGHVAAQYNVGVFYFNGKGVTKSLKEAVPWWRKAAGKGFTNAQFNLGLCYKEGTGVEVSLPEAKKWLRVASLKGHKKAAKVLSAIRKSKAEESIKLDDNKLIKKKNGGANDYDPQTVEQYKESYAQDEMGYSDDDIDTIFDGDPLAYWNID